MTNGRSAVSGPHRPRPLSILRLTDQLVGAIENSGGGIWLERRADWLIMASQLLLLKAQLLAPANPEAAVEADDEARRRLAQLDELARMRAGAAWLAARPQLGQQVFPRGQDAPPPRRPQEELYVAFLEATLAMLESREGQRKETPQAYRPAPPDLWRLPDTMLRITELPQRHPGGLPLERCFPVVTHMASDRPLRLRAAVAVTLVAGLELAANGRSPSARRGLRVHHDRAGSTLSKMDTAVFDHTRIGQAQAKVRFARCKCSA